MQAGRTLLFCVCASALLRVSSARAENTVQIERAKASFRAGAAAYAAGEYPAAIQALEAAYELTPLPAIAFSLAQAERRQYFVARDRAHLERAITLFRSYVTELPRGGRAADALDALSQLEPLLVAAAGALPPASAPLSPTQTQHGGQRATRLMITCEAPDARISFDQTPAVPTPSIHEVTPGLHQVLVEAAGFFPSERKVTAVAGELILIEVVLRELPASLIVSSAEDTELYIDGSFVGHGGANTALSLPSGPHRLTVTQLGHHSALRSVQLARGQRLPIDVELEPTLLHKVTRALLVGGGVALGAGVVLGALAYREQRHAESFLDKQKQGNVSLDQLGDYRTSAHARDRLRLGADLSLSSAAAMLLSALVAYELDRRMTNETSRRSVGSNKATSARLFVTPALEVARRGPAQASGTLQLGVHF